MAIVCYETPRTKAVTGLSIAFDTIDQQLLLSRLETVFDIRSTALHWFRS